MTFDIPAGVTLVPFPIPIVDDSTAEPVEQFTISLSTMDPFAELGPDSTVQINDDDRECGIV